MTGLLYLCIYSFASSGGVLGETAGSAPPDIHPARTSAPTVNTVNIPGPLRSFLRMAGISQKVGPEDVLPLLARNIYMQGYQIGKPTEFLILLSRYVDQARELQILAGPSSTIRVAGCTDAGTLVRILGYRVQGGCGQKNVTLETADPERAFLTIDSGFPLVELEEALQKETPFLYPYPVTRVPVLLREGDWVALNSNRRRASSSLVDVLVDNPTVARLYWALAKNDSETRLALDRSPGLRKLLPFAPALDFYGSQIRIRSGVVVVPGGPNAEPVWKELVGASPESPGDFVIRLLMKDRGWMATYFDVLSRVSQRQQAELIRAPRLKRLYEAFRPENSEPTATNSVFRKAPGLLVLFTRIKWEPNGEFHVPGDLETWKEILHQKTDSKIVHEWSKRTRNWDHSEQLLEAMVAFSRIETGAGPLQIYLATNEMDLARSPEKRLSAGTVRLLADKFSRFGDWYLVFAEFPELSDSSISRFLNVADGIDEVSNSTLRGNVLGVFQANLGLWQILARQGEIPNTELNTSWESMISPFTKISSSTQLFDAARSSLGSLLHAASGKETLSQEEVIKLLAGPPQQSEEGERVRAELAGKIRLVLDDQRLVSLDTLFGLADGLNEMAQGAAVSDKLLPLAGALRDFEMPRPIFTNTEKVVWAPRVYTTRHAELQVRTDLAKVIKSSGSRAQLDAARGQLAPFLRDTLVGLNYAYYEPPGAQMLHNNPLFVRAHDFSGVTIDSTAQTWHVPGLFGVGAPAGGGAYLVGSLADLPYALATTEEDFIAPENVQALVWKELIPNVLISATERRWWSVTPVQLHAVALYQRSGEELLAASVGDASLQGKVMGILPDLMGPQQLEEVQQALIDTESLKAVLPRILPADTFYLSAEFRRKFPDEVASRGPASQELDSLCRLNPVDASWERLSKDFGVPHPTLADTYSPALLDLKPFPFFGGYSARLFSESWQSNNLYWARLADEMGYSPVRLNRLVPELTRRMTAKIFATNLEDWPALQRAMRETGDEFRQGRIALPPTKSPPNVSGEQ
ncbi:MAG: hypothetical protein JWQ42_1096 [Edaphobacter sp.]|nr:hypothetical protein [Edaphobacter sp.]